MSARTLFISPHSISVGVSERKTIGLFWGEPNQDLGLAPGLGLALELSVCEARALAAKLIQRADELEYMRPH
jgi:hypothetical protein